MDEQVLQAELGKYKFYHTIQLTPTIKTPGWSAIVPIAEMVSRVLKTTDLRNKRVLDIGCRDGLFCFEAEKLGAREVIGFDMVLSPGIPELLIGFFRSAVKIHSFNLFDLTPSSFGLFDVVVFPGVLYHLRYPCWALKLIRDVMVDGGTMVLETAVLVDDNRHAVIFSPIGDESPYEPTSCTFFNCKGLHDTLTSFGFTVQSLERLHKTPHERGKALPDKPLVDRCVVVCTKTLPPKDGTIRSYWEGTVTPQELGNWAQARRTKPAK